MLKLKLDGGKSLTVDTKACNNIQDVLLLVGNAAGYNTEEIKTYAL
jgi:hypothetical protein